MQTCDGCYECWFTIARIGRSPIARVPITAYDALRQPVDRLRLVQSSIVGWDEPDDYAGIMRLAEHYVRIIDPHRDGAARAVEREG